MKLIRTILTYTAVLLAILLLTGFVYEQIARIYFNNRKPADTAFVTVGERKLHFKKLGKGDTTVIFESGLGGDHLHWQDIQARLSQRYTTLAYDKAGILWSDPSTESSLERYTSDLEQILQKTNCPKPYIIVDHSFGGITSRLFIKKHAKDMAGVVYVDVTHPLQLKSSSDELRKSAAMPPKWLVMLLNQTGVLRLTYSLTPFSDVVPKHHWFNKNVTNYFYRILPGLLHEAENDEKLMEQAEAINSFGTIPLTIITAKYPNGAERITDSVLSREYLNTHNRLQRDLLHLSTQSKQVIAEKSGHYITLQQPQLIIDAVTSIKPVTDQKKR